MKNKLTLIILLLICGFGMVMGQDQAPKEGVERKENAGSATDFNNSVKVRGFFIPNEEQFYFINPTFGHRYNIISIETGLFLSSNRLSGNDVFQFGVSVGYIVKPFKNLGKFEPFFDNRLFFLAKHGEVTNPAWQGGGMLEIGTGLEYRIKRSRVGVGFGLGLEYFYRKTDDFVQSLSIQMLPNLSFSYSF